MDGRCVCVCIQSDSWHINGSEIVSMYCCGASLSRGDFSPVCSLFFPPFSPHDVICKKLRMKPLGDLVQVLQSLEWLKRLEITFVSSHTTLK